MVEKAKILKHHTDAPAHLGDRVLFELRSILPEQADVPARRLERQQDQAQQSGLAGAGRAGQKLKGLRTYFEADVPQDLSSHSVTQADILESDHRDLVAAFLFRGEGTHKGGTQTLCRTRVNPALTIKATGIRR